MGLNYTEVVSSLQRKNDCNLQMTKEIIEVLNPRSTKRKNDLGNGSFGKIDFLVSQGWRISRVNELS